MRGGLGRNVAANIANVAIGIGLALVSTPLIIHSVGKSGFGVWVLAVTFVFYLAIAEAGLAPAAQRFIAVSQGKGDVPAAARVLWSTLAAYTVLGVVAGGALALLADPLASAFDLSSALEDDARDLFRIIGLALPITLVGACLANVLAGLERFVAAAIGTAIGSLAYFVAIVYLVIADAGLVALGWAVVLQQAVTALARLVPVRDVFSSGAPVFFTRAEWRRFLGFAGKLQVSVLSMLVNGQSDKVVVGLVAPASTVAQVGVASQVAEAGRLAAGGALAPIISRLAAIHGSGDETLLHTEFGRLNRLWLLVGGGAIVVGAASLYPLITAWLGDGYGDAIVFGEFLVLAYGVNVLAGTRAAYLRAIDRVDLEAWYGGLTIALNLALTIPLAILFDALGVVCGTLLAYLLSTSWFVARFRSVAPPVSATPLPVLARALALAVLSGALALGWGAAMVEVLPAGVALLPVGAGSLASFAFYVSAITGVRPTPRALGALLAAPRTAEG